jgi:hypothetical protein
MNDARSALVDGVEEPHFEMFEMASSASAEANAASVFEIAAFVYATRAHTVQGLSAVAL